MEGIKEGIKEGREKGREEGIKEGLNKGIMEGQLIEKRKIAIKMINSGLDINLIISLTGLSADEIRSLKEQN